MTEDLIRLLHEGNYSCVVRNGGKVRTFSRDGVIDLFELYRSDPTFMKGSEVADKVVGKGVAAILALGKVADVWADVLSESACRLLHDAGITVNWDDRVPFIINRTHTGRCPLETACDVADTPEKLYPVISDFVTRMKGNPSQQEEKRNIESK